MNYKNNLKDAYYNTIKVFYKTQEIPIPFLAPLNYVGITKEPFPRLFYFQSNQRINNQERENKQLFGPFFDINRVKFLFNFITEAFKVRGCVIKITGLASLPCTEFFSNKCCAPCVSKLCDAKLYQEIICLVKIFLTGEQNILFARLLFFINESIEHLEFEKTRIFSNLEVMLQQFFLNKRNNYWEKNLTETFIFEESTSNFEVIRSLQKRGKVLHTSCNKFPKLENLSLSQFAEHVIWLNCGVYPIKELRISEKIPSAKSLASFLKVNLGKLVKIKHLPVANLTSKVYRARYKSKFAQIGTRKSIYENVLSDSERLSSCEDTLDPIEKLFFKRDALKVECFDVSQISGTHIVVARKVWIKDRFDENENLAWILPDGTGDVQALTSGIVKRLAEIPSTPKVILIDGGKSHFSAVLKEINFALPATKISLIAAVKPPRFHSHIDRFLLSTTKAVSFNSDLKTHQILKNIRDETHSMVNSLHQLLRDLPRPTKNHMNSYDSKPPRVLAIGLLGGKNRALQLVLRLRYAWLPGNFTDNDS